VAGEVPSPPAGSGQALTPTEFERLRHVPPLLEWLANLDNPNTRRAYRNDVADFMAFAGLRDAEALRTVQRAHVIAWRRSLTQRALAPATLRRKLSALSELFDFLTDLDVVETNPVDGVKRPAEGANEGKTPALSDAQAKRLLAAPSDKSLKGKRDRAILAVLLYHALRRGELCAVRVRDYALRRGVPCLAIHGKGSRLRYLPVHPSAVTLIEEYLDVAGHRMDSDGALFRPVCNPKGTTARPLTGSAVYTCIVKHYAQAAGIRPAMVRPHCLRATAATNALEHGADIAKVRDWLGHRTVSTTQLYDKRASRPEDSPTFKVTY
ncbi:MAG: tyrosine-type recombinase/integrase, partial [Verrucomicrobiales bacterium]|nr:tyrosine-type recombinase/integrase [Verrucomicrobiales bacterium]